MAVHATDDRSVDLPPLDSSPTPSSRLYYVSAALAVVVVLCLVVLLMFFVKASGSFGQRVSTMVGRDGAGSAAAAQSVDLTDQRNAAMSVADQFILRINDYGPHDLDAQNTMPGYVQQVDSVISAKLRAGFEQSVKLAEQSVAQTGYGRTATLFATAVSTIDADSATVLVAGSFTSSYPDKAHPLDASKRKTYEAVPFRYQIPMVMIDGAWKVDDFISVTDGSTTSTSTGTTGTVPDFQGQAPGSGSTSTPPSSKPNSKSSSKPSGRSTTGARR